MAGLLPVLLCGVLHVTIPASSASSAPVVAQEADLLEMGHRAFQRAAKKFLLPTLELGALYVPSVVWATSFSVFNATVRPDLPLQQYQDRFWAFNHWNEPTFERWTEHITSPPVFPDKDGPAVNYLIHPWVGASVHMLYRNHGASFWEAFVLTVIWAVLWEYVAEAGYERPSLNDVMANAGGALMGEAGYRAKVLLLRHMAPGFPRDALVTLLDPFGALEDIVLDAAEHHASVGPLVRYLR
jgi:hypothetical protein